MKERIKAINEYLKYFPNDIKAKENLLLCKYADELNIELRNEYFPRVEQNRFVINSQIEACKKYYLAKSATQYNQNGIDTIIVWNARYGRLGFVHEEYYDSIEDEWREFHEVLKLYNPIDYDEINHVYIYDLENGKRLINEYDKILQDFVKKVTKKIRIVEIENKKKRIEELQKELMEINQNE